MSRCLANAVHPAVIFRWISPCLRFCLWCRVFVPGRCSFQLTFSICMGVVVIGVSFSIITFIFDLFIFTPWFSLSSANSCSICCSSRGVLSHMSISSAKRRCLRYSPSIFNVKLLTGFPSQSSEYAFECCRKQLSWCCSCCFLCVAELSSSFYISFLKRGQYCLCLHWVEGFLIVDECDAN